MPGGRYSLEISEMTDTECRNLETEEGMISALSKDTSSFSPLTELLMVESRPYSKPTTVWSKKE